MYDLPTFDKNSKKQFVAFLKNETFQMVFLIIVIIVAVGAATGAGRR